MLRNDATEAGLRKYVEIPDQQGSLIAVDTFIILKVARGSFTGFPILGYSFLARIVNFSLFLKIESIGKT